MPQNEGDSGVAAPTVSIDEHSLLTRRLSTALQEEPHAATDNISLS